MGATDQSDAYRAYVDAAKARLPAFYEYLKTWVDTHVLERYEAKGLILLMSILNRVFFLVYGK